MNYNMNHIYAYGKTIFNFFYIGGDLSVWYLWKEPEKHITVRHKSCG